MPVLVRNVQTVDSSGGITVWRIGSAPPATVHDQIPGDAWDDAVAAPAPEPVPHGTVAEIEDWVGGDPVRAQAALDEEVAGQNRVTLVAWLESVIHGAE